MSKLEYHSAFSRHQPRSIVAYADGPEAEVVLYDEIGYWGVTAAQVREELRAVQARTINVRINSPGGDIFDAIAIYNALREHPARVVSHVDGLAASAATIVALGGDEVRMAANGFWMIHDPWVIAIGNADQLRKDADLLDKISGTVVETYRNKTGRTVEEVEAWMDAETWFTAAEAAEAGFVDAVENIEEEDLAAAAAARFDLSIYSHVPETLKARGSEPKEPTRRELEKALRDAGLSRSAAARMVARGLAEPLRDAGQHETHPDTLLDQARLMLVAQQLKTSTDMKVSTLCQRKMHSSSS